MIDAHHHVWHLARGDYDWPTPDMPIYRDYGLGDLRAVCGDVRGTVLVQTAPTEAETEFMLQVAAGSGGLVRGVVGWTDLAAADAVEKVRMLAAKPGLVGLRPMLQGMADPDWILRPAVAPALNAMAEAGLALDLLIRTPQLGVVPLLAREHPPLRMVIDHAAKPQIRDGAFQPWADGIARAAAEPGVHCKLSGLITEAAPGWDAATLRPYTDHLLTCFGEGRLLWGSDWPVVTLAGGYGAWAAATQMLLGPLSAAGRALVMGGTAESFYRLGVTRGTPAAC